MASQERSPVNIAVKFAKAYYLLHGVETASKLLTFYQEDSSVTRGNEIPGVGDSAARGLDKIKTLVTDPTYLTRSQISIRTIDAQFVADSADISLLVVGELEALDGLRRTFAQTFLLAVAPGSEDSRHYYVKNDIFRYLSSSLPETAPQSKSARVQEQTPAPQQAPAQAAKAEAMESVAAPPAKQEAPAQQEQPAQEPRREQAQEDRRRQPQQRGGQQRNPRQQEKKEEPKPVAPVSWAARVAQSTPSAGDSAAKESAPVKQARPPQGPPPKAQQQPAANGHTVKGVPNSPITSPSLHVGNISYTVTEDQLREHLLAPTPDGYGWEGVTNVQLAKGHGFVDFKTVEYAQIAYASATASDRTPIQLNGRELRVEPKTSGFSGSRSGRTQGVGNRRKEANSDGNRRTGAQ